MDSINIKLENCHGIKKLEHTFDFSRSRVFAIYAPNGSMKTSFAKTLNDIALNQESRDNLFPARPTVREVTKDGGNPVTSEEIFVVLRYSDEFVSSKMSTLLVNKTLRIQYDEIFEKINREKETFLKEMKKISGLKPALIEDEISLVFTSTKGEFFTSLSRLEGEVTDGKDPEFPDVEYSQLFNDKALAFLTQDAVREKIQEYITVYEDLISKSKYFKKGIFTHNNAAAIARSLADNGFFDADHSVFLHSDQDGDNKIKTVEDLEKVIEEEKQTILNNPALKKAFEDLDKKFDQNVNVRDLRDYLARNKTLLPELGGKVNGLRQKIWRSYFKVHKSLYLSLIGEYRNGETKLREITEQANAESSNWLEVISIFEKRFSVPFKLRVENRSGVILKDEIPNIVFEYADSDDRVVVDRGHLEKSLSTGEQRALYLLNIIFEVQARKSSGQDTLFIVDDIADSFDYKNKYAIIQYLKDISEEPIFRQIILTHNFDFYRTLERRFVGYGNCFAVEKSSEGVKLLNAEYIHNPFLEWKRNLATNDTQLVASIPFVRNLIEYTRGDTDPEYALLTSLLHIKKDTGTITKRDLAKVYANTFGGPSITFSDPDKKIYELIFELIGPCLASSDSVRLENKVLLAIGIRLKAEEFVLSRISNKVEPPYNQTQVLIERYEKEFGTKSSEGSYISTLQDVLLMTPENIHLNSFMYEPILDMSDESLKKLCKEVQALK